MSADMPEYGWARVIRARGPANLRALAILVVLAAPGCGGLPTGDHLAADRAIYEAVAPEYRAYLEADPALDAEQKNRRRRTLRVWERLVAGEEGTGEAGDVKSEGRP